MLGPLTLLASSVFSAYHVTGTEVSYPQPNLERVVYHVQVGPSPLNRFAITRVHKHHALADGSLILLSPFLLPGAFYEISESGRYADSAAARLALGGVDVWLVDQRRTGLASGACESGAADCSVMLDWNFDTYADDALFALSLLKQKTPCWSKPALGGFSAGSNAALATLNRAPQEFSGVFLYEGTFHTQDPDISTHNDPLCSQLEDRLANGDVYDASAGVPGLVLRLAAAAPNEPSPIFPPGVSNELSMFLVFGSPPPPGALSPTAGFVRCATDFATQSFVYTDEARLKLTGPLFDNYGSVAALRDLSCGLAGRDDSHYDNVSAFRGNALIFVEGTGFGPAMFDTAALFGPRVDVTIEQHAELGEADPYFHRSWQRVFLKPLQKWLRRTL